MKRLEKIEHEASQLKQTNPVVLTPIIQKLKAMVTKLETKLITGFVGPKNRLAILVHHTQTARGIVVQSEIPPGDLGTGPEAYHNGQGASACGVTSYDSMSIANPLLVRF